ncbi:hypothetical protein CASFOL_036799 [Castilleja foliolosa]|uniref:TPM domain-containing protein n=1 Tax=Castilleja foliolosa TaxID=1961234 RepID=A0ABD3BPM9_9LAMI
MAAVAQRIGRRRCKATAAAFLSGRNARGFDDGGGCSENSQSAQQSSHKPTSWLANVQQGLAALVVSLALNFSSPILANSAFASEFDVLNDGPPKETYVVDDAGVLSRVTRSDLKRLLSDLESRKGYHINIVTVRNLTERDDVGGEMSDRVIVHGCKRARGGGDSERERNMVVVHGGDWLRFGVNRLL